MPNLIDGLALALVLSAFVASLAFCVAYHLTAKWWEHPIGVSLMIYQVVMTAFMALTAWRWIVWPDGDPSPAFEVVRTVSFAALPVVLLWRTAVLIRVQRREGRRSYGD